MKAPHHPFLAAAALLAAWLPVHADSGEQWEYSMSMVAPDGTAIPMNTLRVCRSAAAALKPAFFNRKRK